RCAITQFSVQDGLETTVERGVLIDDVMAAPAPAGRLCPRCGDTGVPSATSCPVDDAPLIVNRRGLVVADRYEVAELIGLGGMGGTVWAAVERPFDRPVAVKFVPTTHYDAARR